MDVHVLREEPGFEGQDIYFYLNHPIRFVRLVGLVVQIDSFSDGKWTILTLDDSSGANIEVKIEKRTRATGDDAQHPSNTLVDNVNVLIELGRPTILVNAKPLELGTVIGAQGIITTFRQSRQLSLKRIFRVKDTNEEALHWGKAVDWKQKILSNRWVLSRQQQDAIDEQVRQEERKEQERARLHRKKQAKYDEKYRQKRAAREEKRQIVEAQFNKGALPGSEILPRPWD
ncbi:hypothetical protein DOTSEDRAFT_33627 [Dothistroma septosporum NZE10]|uniref:CST complex subunit STN1 n=1 Tax=Dothistroma septosporum (strain NZE10 / CBS 128990) TaxID=675120 RepID=N1PNN2_DOTSN|nr:hypothetical protein DOTSEDRAFT_33627 [Dothistroma septosporum NZE10]